ncbi:hypothetical protein ACFQ4C_01600 [Larkinella insperata]|uniref:Uncharacterized protein n=1 Tax=Larkinella insperata TaxID=332158 RepID=A0ABW3Q0W3_9BACT|nr:hypothetical protein [Larkinella insperata]
MAYALLIIGLLGTMAGMVFRYCTKWILARERLQFFAAEYERALRGNDKNYALAAGRSYFDVLRGGKRSKEDEEHIESDIALMVSEQIKTLQLPIKTSLN